LLQVLQQFAGVQSLTAQMMVDDVAHETFALVQACGVVKVGQISRILTHSLVGLNLV